MKHSKPKTKKPKTKPHILDTSIKDLPLSVFRIPPNEWILSLRRLDGSKETRKVRGTLFEARSHRDIVMKSGKYSEAWLIEGKEQKVRKTKRVGRKRGETLYLAIVMDSEPYYTEGDF